MLAFILIVSQPADRILGYFMHFNLAEFCTEMHIFELNLMVLLDFHISCEEASA